MLLTVMSMKTKPSSEIEALDKSEEHTEEESEDEDEGGFSVKAFIIEALVAFAGGAFMIYKGGIIKWIGIALMAMFAIYAAITLVNLARKKAIGSMFRDIFFIVIGAAVIAGGANLLVDSGIFIAEELGVPQTVIALTFVALGTSLPELVTAITALAKGHGALSLGNIIGANLFNLVLVSGVSTVIAPFAIPSEQQIAGIPSSLVLDVPLMLGVMALMTIPALIRGKLSRIQGILLLCIYAGFCTLQFVL
jgi:cation:H+ antiporter